MHTSRNIRNAGTISIYLLFFNPVKIYEVWSMKYELSFQTNRRVLQRILNANSNRVRIRLDLVFFFCFSSSAAWFCRKNEEQNKTKMTAWLYAPGHSVAQLLSLSFLCTCKSHTEARAQPTACNYVIRMEFSDFSVIEARNRVSTVGCM